MHHGLTSEKRCLRSSSSGGKKSTTGGGGGHLLGIRPNRKGFCPNTCCQFPLYPTSNGLLHTFHVKKKHTTESENMKRGKESVSCSDHIFHARASTQASNRKRRDNKGEREVQSSANNRQSSMIEPYTAQHSPKDIIPRATASLALELCQNNKMIEQGSF